MQQMRSHFEAKIMPTSDIRVDFFQKFRLNMLETKAKQDVTPS